MLLTMATLTWLLIIIIERYRQLEKNKQMEFTFNGTPIKVITGEKPNGYNFLGQIYITSAALQEDEEILEATLWHELGHKKEKHSWIMLIYLLTITTYFTMTLQQNPLIKTIQWILLLILEIPISWITELRADLYAAKHIGPEKVLKMLSTIKKQDLLHPPKRVRILIIK